MSENKNILREYNCEPVIGHHYQIQFYEPDTVLDEQLSDIRERLDLEQRDRRRVEITEHDVAWDEPRTMTMTKEVFEDFIEWYEGDSNE